MKINLSSKDENHLNKFKKSIDGEDLKIDKGLQNSFGTITEYARLEANSATMTKDLKALGCVERKSLILKFPTEEQVPKELIMHFIRGYYDGDGSFTFGSGKYPQASLNFIGTMDFLIGVKENLKVVTPIKIDKRKNIPYLMFGGNKNALEKLNMMYKDATIYLDRKYNNYKILKSKFENKN